jgi:hypothetical protein
LPCPSTDVQDVLGIIKGCEIVLVLETVFDDFILEVEAVGFAWIVGEIVRCNDGSVSDVEVVLWGIEGSSYSLTDIHDMYGHSLLGIRKHCR